MVQRVVGQVGGLNPWQVRAAKERRERETRFVYCSTCRRYRWAEVLPDDEFKCLECGSLVKEKAGELSHERPSRY